MLGASGRNWWLHLNETRHSANAAIQELDRLTGQRRHYKDYVVRLLSGLDKPEGFINNKNINEKEHKGKVIKI